MGNVITIVDELVSETCLKDDAGYAYIKEAVKVCIEQNIPVKDIVLAKHILPALSERFGVTQCAADTTLTRATRRCYERSCREEYVKVFGGSRLTALRFIKKLVAKVRAK